MPAIRIHPDNPKLFEFRGKPIVLLTATEHYGAVMNRPFDYRAYLADAADKGITLTRLFMLFRELQTPINPYSTCKPETPDYIAPFARTGPGRALDKELKYDLDRPNPEFFERLHGFLSLASDYGIIVEIVFLSNTYNDNIWALNPLNAENNINGLSTIHWPEYMSRRHDDLFERQAAHVRRIVTETNQYDNIIYEICNEPGGNFAGSTDNPSLDEVNAWLDTLIRLVRDTEADLPNQHLIAGQEAFSYVPWEQPSDRSFGAMDYDIVNLHPLPNTTYNAGHYHLGDFMSKQLTLRAMRDFGLATYRASKPLNQDEDNVASQYKDTEAWTIHRKRAWVTLMTGNHYDYIDFSIIIRHETGTAESRAQIRSWMKHLSDFIHSLDLVKARPLPDLVTDQPEHCLATSLGIEGQDLVIYIADERELTAARDLPASESVARGPGSTIEGRIAVNLPEGSYRIRCYDPATGLYSPAISARCGSHTHIDLPRFTHDIVLRITRA
jgi:hypothetical protein